MGLLCGNCKYERPNNHRGADTSCPLCNTPYHSELAKLGKEAAPLPTTTSPIPDKDRQQDHTPTNTNTSAPLTQKAATSESSLAKKCGAVFGAMGTLQKWLTVIGVIVAGWLVLVLVANGFKSVGGNAPVWIFLFGGAAFYVYKRIRADVGKEKAIASKLEVPLPDFSPTQQVMGTMGKSGLAIDERRNKLCLISVNGTDVYRRIVSCKDILSVELFENGTSVTKTSRGSQIGGVIVGGILLGGVGAIIGGLSGKSESSAKVDRIDLRIVVNDTKSPLHDVSFLVDELYSKLEKQRDIARRWHGIISALIKRAETEEQSLRVAEERKAPQKQPSTSVADELKKLAELHDSGVLTLEEFQQQKTRVLG